MELTHSPERVGGPRGGAVPQAKLGLVLKLQNFTGRSRIDQWGCTSQSFLPGSCVVRGTGTLSV